MRLLPAVAAVAVLAAACTDLAPPVPVRVKPAPRAEKAQKAAVHAPHARLRITAGREAEASIRRAISQLRGLRLWRGLTGHLDHIVIRARSGRASVPPDRHLADSLYRPFGRRGRHRYCRVTFYPRSMRDDLVDQRAYYERGRLRVKPPRLRDFWVGVLAHELTHCRDHRRGEKIALRVEHRVLERLSAEGR